MTLLRDSLLWAFEIDGAGGARELAAEELTPRPEIAAPGFHWVHLDLREDDARSWLEHDSRLPHDIAEALLAIETRPRYEPVSHGALINLRGVNHNPGADPEDMVSVRIWVEPRLVVTTRRYRLLAVQDMRDNLLRGVAPATPGELISRIALRLAQRIDPVVLELADTLDGLEDDMFEGRRIIHRSDLAEPRSDAIQIRRYVSPQKEALRALSAERADWMNESDRRRFGEAADAAARVVEELEEVRERAAVLNDLMADARAERMNNNMMILSVVAAIFLPLGLVSGMMGINVGGMPWVDDPHGFWYVVALVAGLGVVCAGLFRLAKWI